MQPTSHYLRCCERELHYVEWGRKDAPPVIMWHGLARTGRDFDDLAAALAGTYRILCPDTIGRGLSQWSPEPAREYCLEFYARTAQALADQLGLQHLRWVGTSMGGAIGMVAATTTLQGRISHLVLNDIGPEVPVASSERISAYVGNPAQFDTVTAFEAYLRTIYKPFGALSDAQWRHLAETSVRRLPSGKVTAHYDPAMAPQLVAHASDYDLWGTYDTLRMPTLVLRGETSDLLLPETAQAMTRRGPKARLVELPGCGHAPALNVSHQIELVREFLTG